MFVQSLIDSHSDLGEVLFRTAVAGKATADVQEGHDEAQLLAVVHDHASILDGVHERFAGHLTAAAVKARESIVS